MAIRDKTINDSIVSVDLLTQRVNTVESNINILQQGRKFVGNFNTESELKIAFPTPLNGDWATVSSSENPDYLGRIVQYLASDEIWRFFSTIENTNEASLINKGVIRLAGDLGNSLSTASYPQLSNTGVIAGSYNLGNGNVIQVDSKGRLLNINISTTNEWNYISQSNTRIEDTTSFIVPTYNLSSSQIWFIWNGYILIENRDWIRINTTTINTNFTVKIDDDVAIINFKNTGTLDISNIINDTTASDITCFSSNKTNSTYATLDNNIIPSADATFDLGSTVNKYDNIYLQNAPTVLSSRNFKENIKICDLGLDFVKELNPVLFNYKGHVRTHSSFIAEEVEELLNGRDFGGFVHDSKSGVKALRLEQFIPILVKSIQEQQEQISYLKLSIWKKIYIKIKNLF